MTNARYVSTAQVAQALGVGVSTVKRWVDEGILPAHKTAGGHRKLLLSEVLRRVRESDFPRLDLGGLELAAEGREPPGPEELSGRLVTALRTGDATAVRSLFEAARRSGLATEVLADFVIAPAMHRLGHDWEEGRIDILHEHRGTQLCAAALYVLKAELEAGQVEDRPLAIGGAPERDPYSLASLLAEMVLLDAGWRVVNLGPHTPMASFGRGLEELRPRLLWISVSHLEDRQQFLAEYDELYRVAGRSGVAVAVGGRALTEPVRSGMSYTSFGDGLRHLAAFARSLHGASPRPRRGRPPGPAPPSTA